MRLLLGCTLLANSIIESYRFSGPLAWKLPFRVFQRRNAEVYKELAELATRRILCESPWLLRLY
jgi:hypothetical protein